MSSLHLNRLRVLCLGAVLCIALVVACDSPSAATTSPTELPVADVEISDASPTRVPEPTPAATVTVVETAEDDASATMMAETVAPPTPTPTPTPIPTPIPTATAVPLTATVPSPVVESTPTPPTPEPTATAIPPPVTPYAMTDDVVPDPTSTPEAQDDTEQPDTANPETETPTPEVTPTVAVATMQPPPSAEDYFEGRVEPCESATSDFDPCEPSRDIEFQGVVPVSYSLPDRPPSLEELLFNSWSDQDLADVPNHDLTSATHIIARGRFEIDSVVCQGYPVVFQAWSIDFTDFGIPEPGPGEQIFLGASIYHWMCFANLQVHEYMVGKGGASITVMLAAASIPYYDEAEPNAPEAREVLELHRMAVAAHFSGPEWVVWLAPAHTAALESWTAYSLWGVQRGDDGVVRVISPVLDYYDHLGDSEYEHEHLMAPLDEFRQLIADADASRLERTSGRIGVGADTPMLVQDALRLSDYYHEIGAYEHPTLPPMQPPTLP